MLDTPQGHLDMPANSPIRMRAGPHRWIVVAKIAILVLVSWGAWQSIAHVRDEFQSSALDPGQLRWSWFGTAAAAYAIAQVFPALFWRMILQRLGFRVTAWDAYRAFNIGHLGKYVPTKMLVVVIRGGLVSREPGMLPVSMASVFIETLTTMAAGAALATLAAAGLVTDRTTFWMIAGCFGMCMVGSLPMVMRSCAEWALGKRFPGVDQSIFRAIDWRLSVIGWGYALLYWCVLSLSAWAIIRMMPANDHVPLFNLATAVRVLAATCLAVVAGFVTLIPGGLVAREWALGIMLAPLLGTTAAVAVPILLRLNWLLTELLSSVILWWMGSGHRSTRT